MQYSPNKKLATIVDGDDFRAMPIKELMAHEKGILNLLEKEDF
jgi:hypothetical protein